MFIFQSKVTVYSKEDGKPKIILPSSVSINIQTSRNTFTDTATVTLPNDLKSKNRRIQDVVKPGDRITIQMRYVPNTSVNYSRERWDDNIEFDGYVNKINPDSPLTIYCEDEMYKLKRKALAPKYFEKTTFKQVLDYLAPGYEKVIQDAKIGDFKTSGSVTPVDAFDALRKNFNAFIYFRGKTLYCEILVQQIEDNRTLKINSNKNVPLDGESLTYQSEEDALIVANVISENNKTGEKISRFYYYDENIASDEIKVSNTLVQGNINKFKVPNLTVSEADVLGKRYLQNLWYTGVEGTIETFGEPSFIHGDTAELSNLRVKERDGKYRVASITKTFGVDTGYRQLLELSKKID